MIEADLRLRAVVPAPPKTVYGALTDPAALRVWLAEHAEVELPGKYEFWGRYTPDGTEPHQRVLHVDESSIRFAWTVDGVETTAVRAGRGRERHAGHAEPERPAELRRHPGRQGRCPWRAADVLVPGDRESGGLPVRS